MGFSHGAAAGEEVVTKAMNVGISAENASAGVNEAPDPIHEPFRVTRRLAVLDQFGVPCTPATAVAVDRRYETLTGPTGARLMWPSLAGRRGAPIAARLQIAPGNELPIFASVLSDSEAMRSLSGDTAAWSALLPIADQRGERVGSVWRHYDGSWLLPFDPDEVRDNYYSECYLSLMATRHRLRVQGRATDAYYHARVILPRSVQIWLRRRYATIQARATFPRWPIETALHDFFDMCLGLLADVCGDRVPCIAPWPDGHSWALVLTHDVETAAGVAAARPVVELERSLGLRSCWNFVPRRYELDESLIEELVADGFEVGVHGLRHDGRDVQSLAGVRRRLPAIRAAADRWGSVGFRAPAMRRRWELMPLLGFDHDSSYPDTDAFEPQPGGCCTWLPFFNQDLVELPLTLPQDHTLFVILGHRDETAWVQKTRFLSQRGGLAQIVTHPDYLVQPEIMASYRRFLELFANDEGAWRALPREVSGWWRRRAASTLEPGAAGWCVQGPAAPQATVALSG